VSFSGGGFSNYFTRPSYQSTTVANYLTSIGTKNQGLFKYVPGFGYAKFPSTAGRIPDIVLTAAHTPTLLHRRRLPGRRWRKYYQRRRYKLFSARTFPP